MFFDTRNCSFSSGLRYLSETSTAARRLKLLAKKAGRSAMARSELALVTGMSTATSMAAEAFSQKTHSCELQACCTSGALHHADPVSKASSTEGAASEVGLFLGLRDLASLSPLPGGVTSRSTSSIGASGSGEGPLLPGLRCLGTQSGGSGTCRVRSWAASHSTSVGTSLDTSRNSFPPSWAAIR